jgi:DNA polymerase
MMGKQQKLDKLKERMEADKSLPLRSGATKLVFGEGSSDTDYVFIGEGPGYWEDQKGIPFVGNAGAFLNQLISIMGKEREEVYISNVVHYRPPQNRDPSTEEIEAFQPYLDEMIKIINPNIIVTLGRFSMAKFIPGVKISSVHGKPRLVSWKRKDLIVVPMYHPAAGLRNPSVKMSTINDFKNLKDEIEEVKVKLEEKKEEKKTEQMELM